MELYTKRLILRPWKKADLEPFAQINADPIVMEFFPSLLSKEESDQFAQRIIKIFDDHGYGLWAVEVPGIAPFIGYVGLRVVDFSAPFTPAVEIGWRIAKEYWGMGYAPEAALASLQYGFETLNLDKIVSFTVPSNVRSRKVMEKIGLKHHPELDFDHERIPVGHPLKRHVLYQMTRKEWKE